MDLGSIPSRSTRERDTYAREASGNHAPGSLAQSGLERRPVKAEAAGSNPV
jgi:hypothetical protein